MKIAIIGGGIAGVGAARQLVADHDITLYEAGEALGGSAHAVEIDTAEGRLEVDMGVIATFPGIYKHHNALFRTLGIPTTPRPLTIGACFGPDAWWTNQAGNRASAMWARVAPEVARFEREVLALAARPLAEIGRISVMDYLGYSGYSQELIDRVLVPMFTTKRFRADLVACENLAIACVALAEGLLSFRRPTVWTRWDAGTRDYFERLTSSFVDRVRLATPVVRVVRESDDVELTDAHGRRERFDQVIFAISASFVLELLADPHPDETQVLSGLRSVDLDVVLHADASVLGEHFREQPIVQYVRAEGSERGARHFDLRQWMQWEHLSAPLIMSVDPPAVDPALIHARRRLPLDDFSSQGMYMRRLLPTIQGARRTWFCGQSFAGSVFEEALCSGFFVAEQLGAPRPFQDDPECTRQYEFVKSRILGLP